MKYKLSPAQLYALDLASRYKLQRSSMGWWAVDHRGSALSDPVEILSPNTIKSLWRLGLLDGPRAEQRRPKFKTRRVSVGDLDSRKGAVVAVVIAGAHSLWAVRAGSLMRVLGACNA
jgi:hypothetical protein